MVNYADVVMAGIDRIMKDCANGVFGEDYAIQKIKELTEVYTAYRKVLCRVNAIKDRSIALRKELGEVEKDFDAACHERDDVLETLDAMLEDL